MKLFSFRIRNYRSIVDTDWCDLSPDNITVLIGQNESGKTAILEALHAFDEGEISNDDLRSDDSMPEVICSFELNEKEFNYIFKETFLPIILNKKLKEKKYRINLKRIWKSSEENILELDDHELSQCFEQQLSGFADESAKNILNDFKTESQESQQIIISMTEFIDRIYKEKPLFVLFKDFESLLPDTIDLADIQSKNDKIEGYRGALNFLKIAKLDVIDIEAGDLRIIKSKIESINEEITKGFQEFWHQKIGKEKKIKIEFSLERHKETSGDKAGKPFIAFWISDGKDKLYPKQRSRGVRWFLSFYLQLQASAADEKEASVVYLIDEPGGSLHARAQEDVLKVFDSLKNKLQVIYTTHSPYLIKPDETIYRILAVQRADEENEKSETKVLSVHKLGSASSDTLSPIYTQMGVDFSHQQVIKKTNNVILEEISAFYYFSAFWKLVSAQKEAHFIAATGTSNIPQLANLFLCWGLDFIIVIDDDSSGRRIYNELKKNLYNDDEQRAKEKMIKIKECSGIEDIFNKSDFRKFILKNEHTPYSESNSEYMKNSNLAKPIFALDFMLRVKNGEVNLSDFGSVTQGKIKELMELIESKLT